MKQLFLTFSLAACLISLSSFANDSNPEALNSFFKTFRNAKNVNWTQVDNLLRIGFTLNNQQQFAYYNNDELVVVATEIKMEELPVALKTQLSAYDQFSVKQAYQLVSGNVKEYCVMLQSPSKNIILKGKSKWKLFDQRL